VASGNDLHAGGAFLKRPDDQSTVLRALRRRWHRAGQPGEVPGRAQPDQPGFGVSCDRGNSGRERRAADDTESFKANREALQDCQRIIEDPDRTQTEKAEAEAEKDRIALWVREHERGTEGSEQKQVRAIRQSIRRVLETLEQSRDEVWRGFGQHLDKCLWKPSGRSRGGRNARVRSGLAGQFIYEPPNGVKWRG